MMKIAALAEAFHLPCEIHDAYNATGNLATAHVAMVVPSCSMRQSSWSTRPAPMISTTCRTGS